MTTGIILLTAIGLLLAMPLLGVVFGAFAGWLVSLFFEDALLAALRSLGADTGGLELWQLGALLGFVGAFFKATLTNKASD